VKSVVRFRESALPQLLPFAPCLRGHVQIFTYTHAFTVIHQTICRNVEVIKDFEKPQCFQVKRRWLDGKLTVQLINRLAWFSQPVNQLLMPGSHLDL